MTSSHHATPENRHLGALVHREGADDPAEVARSGATQISFGITPEKEKLGHWLHTDMTDRQIEDGHQLPHLPCLIHLCDTLPVVSFLGMPSTVLSCFPLWRFHRHVWMTFFGQTKGAFPTHFAAHRKRSAGKCRGRGVERFLHSQSSLQSFVQ